MSYYIHITSQCNMSCAHCCFNYGNGKKGKHMPLDMFRLIMKRSSDECAQVTIGGGELCLYPDFEQMIGIIACYADPDCPPFIVTNGSIRDRALLLNRLASSGIINCDLSQDHFHDSIDFRVVEAFKKRSEHSIRNVTKAYSLLNAGRAKKLTDYELRNDCVCDSMQFLPTGVVKWCGCPRSPIITRNVMESFDHPENYNGECYKDAEELVSA